MDIVAHALWSVAAGIGIRESLKRPVHLGWIAAWGVAPDLVSFTVPACIRIGRYVTGASKSLLPDGTGPRFDWVWNVYNASHSALIFAICFGAVWLFMRRPVLEMLGWGLHVLIDVFTHSGMFAIKFLWPLSSVRVDGKRWETPWLLALNYAVLAAVYLLLWRRRSA
ncbi:MAG TPA: hypothetical protein VMB03_24000 [Bryobacteraceae bacterium]|nr:hypothetical protein [Bryobacteraceae bacterium]